ncbi:MAG: guanylate kinase [Syntrophobacteraceae bacterium]
MLPPAYSGQLYIVSAPSGVGKSTIIRSILEECPRLRFSVSCTTRSPRPDEVNGRDYVFISKEEFLSGIASGRFLEWAEVHGNYYGTDLNPIENWLRSGHDALLDIDVQGARMVRCSYPESRTIFILPPSMTTLQERLQSRATESDEQLRIRMAAARRELMEAPWYDYIIVNDDLQTAIMDLKAVLRAGRCSRPARASRLKAFLNSLIHGADIPS